MRRGRRLRTVLLWLGFASLCAGCSFLQDEFFILDRPPPPDEAAAGAERPW